MSTAKPSGLRVVLDTNIYFSAFTHPQGRPFEIWQKAVSRRYTLLISPAIIREAAKVFREYLDWQESEIIVQLKLITKVAEVIIPKITVKAITEDEADNRILECAVAGRADLVVSGDHHLTRLKFFEGIGIVRPIVFQRILGQL